MILGDILKNYRTNEKLSMDKFAEKSGLTKGYISMLEKNQHPKTKKPLLPTMETLEKIAIGMGIPVHELIAQLDQDQDIALTLTSGQFAQFHYKMSNQVQELDQILVGDYRDKWIHFGFEQVANMADSDAPSGEVIKLSDYLETVQLPVQGKVSAGSGYWQDSDFDNLVTFSADTIPAPQEYDAIAEVVGDSMAPYIANGDYLFIRLSHQVELNTVGIFSVNGENFVKKNKGTYLESLNPDYDDIPLSEDDDIRPIGQLVQIYSPE